MWIGRGRSLTFALVMVAAALAVGVLALVGTKPAEAAFPGVNGKIVFSSERTTGPGVDNPEGDSEIFTMNPDGTRLIQLTFNDDSDGQPAYSANAARIAFTSERTGMGDIYTMNSDGSNQLRRTNNSQPDTAPAWSPGGHRIAFMSQRDGNAELYKMHSDGSKERRLTKKGGLFAAWSPNGKQIAFVSFRNGYPDIYRMKPRPEGRRNRPVNLSKSPAYDDEPNWSPDGKQIVFYSNRGVGGDFEIYKMNADGTAATQLTENQAFDLYPAWSPDGTKITFESDRDGNAEIYTMNSDGSNQTNLTNEPPANDFDPDWQPTTL